MGSKFLGLSFSTNATVKTTQAAAQLNGLVNIWRGANLVRNVVLSTRDADSKIGRLVTRWTGARFTSTANIDVSRANTAISGIQSKWSSFVRSAGETIRTTFLARFSSRDLDNVHTHAAAFQTHSRASNPHSVYALARNTYTTFAAGRKFATKDELRRLTSRLDFVNRTSADKVHSHDYARSSHNHSNYADRSHRHSTSHTHNYANRYHAH